MAHPWANSQVERANGLILDGLKKRLHDENNKKDSKWNNEISSVIWGLRTQPSKATRQSPFFLVYGSEAILPADVMWKSPRLEMYDEGVADDAKHLELNSVEKIRCNVMHQSARYLQGVHHYHDRNIQQCSFNIEDMVLCRIQNETGLHNLNLRWEGPFLMHKVTRPGLYRLQYPDGQEVPNSWNIEHLWHFQPYVTCIPSCLLRRSMVYWRGIALTLLVLLRLLVHN
jgi:hypothetical protein